MKLLTLIVLNLTLLAAMPAQDLPWTQLPNIPDKEGFAYPFAGVSNGSLVVAGGANFPDKKPWEGGTKIWYDHVYLLERGGTWKMTGKLPKPLGYGVSLTIGQGILCLGGSDAQAHYADCYLLECTDGQVSFRVLPSLPKPCANFCGAQVGDSIYVAGGIERPDSTKALHTFWQLDLKDIEAGWKELNPWPGPERMLATAGAMGGKFYLFGGTALDASPDGKPTRRWLQDAYAFDLAKNEWTKLPDLPRVSVAAPTPAPFADGKLLVLGGDDGKQVNVAPGDHKGFPRDVLAYDPAKNIWQPAGNLPFSLVTTPSVTWFGQLVIPGGETRPGIRSPEVWTTPIHE